VVPPNFFFKNKGISFLGVIDGAEHESELRFLISFNLGKIMPTFIKIKQRGGTKGIFGENFCRANI
jgi:hypothetical protein